MIISLALLGILAQSPQGDAPTREERFRGTLMGQTPAQLRGELVLLERRRPTLVAPLVLLASGTGVGALGAAVLSLGRSWDSMLGGTAVLAAGGSIILGLIMLVVKITQQASTDERMQEINAVLAAQPPPEAPRPPPSDYVPGV